MILAEDAPNLGGGSVLIVGREFDNDRHPARRIALVNDLIEVLELLPLTCPTLDGALDVIVRQALRARRLDGGAQAQVAIRIAPAGFRGDGDFLRQFAEDLAAFSVDRAFETLDLRPLAMSGHKRAELYSST